MADRSLDNPFFARWWTSLARHEREPMRNMRKQNLCSAQSTSRKVVLRHLFSRLRPGGELRYLEHVASGGFQGRLQRIADATVWPRLFGNCHMHRHIERAILDAGFETRVGRHEWQFPQWLPAPVAEIALGRAGRQAV